MKQQIQSCLASAERYVAHAQKTLEHCARYPRDAHCDLNLYRDPDGNVWRHTYIRGFDGQAKSHWVKLYRVGFTPWQETQEVIPELAVEIKGGSVSLVNGTLQLARLGEADDEAWEPTRDMSTAEYARRNLADHTVEVEFYRHLAGISEQAILDWCETEGRLRRLHSDNDWPRFVKRFAPAFQNAARHQILHDALLCMIHTAIDKAAGIERTWMF